MSIVLSQKKRNQNIISFLFYKPNYYKDKKILTLVKKYI